MIRNRRDLIADARTIFEAGVDAVRPEPAVRTALQRPDLRDTLLAAPRILVVGAGKAGAGMVLGVESALAPQLDRVEGLVNVPEGVVAQTARIRLHAARPAGSNYPTAQGVAGAREMLQLLATAGREDVALCLISGGGSALLPCPVAGLTLKDKLHVTRLLHASGATINEMNCVRKHLSDVKGGRLASVFPGRKLISLIISDVINDPLDVIASGPTAADPTTFTDALNILWKYDLTSKCPPPVIAYLESGQRGDVPETLKNLPETVTNHIIANNAMALDASRKAAESLGYSVTNHGPAVDGETAVVARKFAAMARSLAPHQCLLIGGETTVTLGAKPGKGGRNQEFVLAMLKELGPEGMAGRCVFSAGTDGEDGPTDAAGACVDESAWPEVERRKLDPVDALQRHDAYPFFDHLGALVRSGLTGTNVMDLRIILVGDSPGQELPPEKNDLVKMTE